MLKRIIILSIIVALSTGTMTFSQISRSYIPNYIKADFFEKFPTFKNYRVNEKVKYYPVNPDIPLTKPDKTRFLSSDGIEVINISGPIWTNAQTETWISINPADPKNIIATANDNAYLSGYDSWRMSAFVSTDGGYNWFHSPTPKNYDKWFKPYQNRATIFDPAIAFDSKGNVYYAYGFAETAYEDQPGKDKNGVFVVKSTDKGVSWNGITSGSDNGIMAIPQDAMKSDGNPFHDRYTMTADIHPNSPYKDYVYIAWRVFRGLDGIVFSRSTNGGETWSAYKRIASGGQAPVPVCGADGAVYLTWIQADFNNQARAMFAKSTDGGNTFGTLLEAQKVFSIGTYDESNGRNVLANKQNIRVSSTPQIAVDNSNGPYKNTIYVVQAGRETPGGNYGIYLAKSTNGGQSFVKNVRIDANTLRNDLFFPSITVDPITGIVAVFYYSSQNDPNNVGVDGYVAISKDGGTTWKHLRVTEETKYLNNQNAVMPQGLSGGVYWGDYTSITSYDGNFFPLFWMPTNGNAFNSNDLFTALISPAPQPPFNLSTETDYEPKLGLKVKWSHPTKNLLGEDLTNFKIIIYRGNEKIGEVTNAQAPEFIDNNVQLGNSYFYKLQTEDNNGYKSTFAEINAVAGGNPKPMPVTNLKWKPAGSGIALSWKNPDKNVDGLTFKDKLKVNIYDYLSNKLIKTVDESSITAGSNSNYLLQIDTKKYYAISIKAVGVRNGVDTESEYTDVVLAYSGEPFASLEENFDNESNIIPNYKTGDWQLSKEKAASAPNSLSDGAAGNYGRNRNDIYLLPPVVLSSGKSTLSFEHIALLDPYEIDVNGVKISDIGEIAYSEDFGTTWKILKWVDSRTCDCFILGDLANSTWQPLAFDLSSNIGDTLLFRFRLVTNNFKENEGWFIDNINIDSRPADVNDQIESISMISVYPNPISNEASVSLRLPVNSEISIEYFNTIGLKISEQNLGLINAGESYHKLDISNLNSGVYYAKMKINNVIKTIQLNVIK